MPNTSLSSDEKLFLLRLARETILDELTRKPVRMVENSFVRLDEISGVFVTLKLGENLRGCIGNIVGQYPLCIGVQKMASEAAFHDPRFSPITLDELPRLHIEVSVLSVLTPVQPSAVVVGKHGLLIRLGLRSGVLLPQVPVEQGWGRKEFLEGLCHKAGLDRAAYLDKDAQLLSFTAQVFSEEEK